MSESLALNFALKHALALQVDRLLSFCSVSAIPLVFIRTSSHQRCQRNVHDIQFCHILSFCVLVVISGAAPSGLTHGSCFSRDVDWVELAKTSFKPLIEMASQLEADQEENCCFLGGR